VKRLRVPGLAVVAIATAALAAGAALAAAPPHKPAKFTASLTGKAVVVIDGTAATITASGTGMAGTLGRVKLFGKGAGTKADPCPLFGGTATLTTAKGRLNLVLAPLSAGACTDEGGQVFALSGRATFKGGTAKFLKAKGTIRFGGSYDRGTGLFSVRFTGLLTI
jgi:hypothetical protein